MSAGERQWKEDIELASELLSESINKHQFNIYVVLQMNNMRVGVAGSQPL